MTSIHEELGLLITDMEDRRNNPVPQGMGLQPDQFGFAMTFANDWGISVIRDGNLFELAVTKDGALNEENSISDDVIRGLTPLMVTEYAKRVSNLNLNG